MAIPDNMQTITASNENIPQFIPLAIGESDAPKHVAQAIAVGVETARSVPMKIETSSARIINN